MFISGRVALEHDAAAAMSLLGCHAGMGVADNMRRHGDDKYGDHDILGPFRPWEPVGHS
jgi:hypothetical protein